MKLAVGLLWEQQKEAPERWSYWTLAAVAAVGVVVVAPTLAAEVPGPIADPSCVQQQSHYDQFQNIAHRKSTEV